ncbi:MAG TPA: N(4)-(beta-N-acetylglucosaminyl)-L-asparaginase [Gemmatimonadaceae bacterium]|jgi:N4-(beta-N-acetylglucosaminyl)-L-asparaginase|nr:N(4)-(beta-N-acetylglucosaminyl)-L-asparaginase [Gemmatimonadaceae bacterium]
MKISRREFLGAGAAAAASLTFDRAAEGEIPRAMRRSSEQASRPVVIASENGIRGVAKAYDMIAHHNADTLDAIIAGVNIEELDPEDQFVGLGGLPNEEGVVQLDASCMHGPTKRAGAVASIEDIATPSLVAKAVMDYTDNILLVGPGAKKFALEMGFKEQNLLTEKSRRDWLRWKACLNPADSWLDSPGDSSASPRIASIPFDHPLHVKFTTGTINMNAVNAAGDISSVTTTSGLSWKIPGRVGDSPIIGAGQYCDNTVGAAGSTGRGEANIKTCGAFLIVEFMRQGMSPDQACMKTIDRVIAMTERRLLDSHGRPLFDLQFYAVAKDGRFGSATAYEGARFAVADAQGARILPMPFRFSRAERPEMPEVSCRRA